MSSPKLTLEIYLWKQCGHCRDVKVFFLGQKVDNFKNDGYQERLDREKMTLDGIKNKLMSTEKRVNIKLYDADKDAQRCKDQKIQGFPTFIFRLGDKNIKRVEGFGGVTHLNNDISETLTETETEI